MLPREDLRRRHQGGLGPGRSRVGEGQHGHHRLARAHIALQQAAHPMPGRKVRADLGQGGALVRGQGEGQGGLHLLGQAGGGQPGARARPAVFAPLGHGQLVSEKLVVGQPRPGGGRRGQVGLALRGVKPQDGLPPGGKAAPRLPGRVLPFGKLRRPLQGALHDAPDHPRRDPAPRRIDRLDLGDLARPGVLHHVVRVDHLQAQAEALEPAGDPPVCAYGKPRLKAPRRIAEPDEVQSLGSVRGADPERLLR